MKMMEQPDIRKLIHAVDPYLGFDPYNRAVDLQGWGGHPEFFERVVANTYESAKCHRHKRSMIIVEVGTWKGKSAIAMADACRRLGIEAQIICVDTWLGATEFWTKHDDQKRYKSLGLVNGYPTVYYQFLTNVMQRGYRDVITPLPQTSTNAARMFQKFDIKADLVYVDASHEYSDVSDDISWWTSRLNVGGVIFGDDYCDHWKGVKDAVDECIGKHENVRLPNADGDAPSDYWIAPPKEDYDIPF